MDYGDNLRRAVIFDSAGHLDDEKYLGTVRISLGQYNKKNDIDQLIDAISEL